MVGFDRLCEAFTSLSFHQPLTLVSIRIVDRRPVHRCKQGGW